MSVRITTPQISWHGREPVLSVDVSSNNGLLATGGSDSEVRLWRVGNSAQTTGEMVAFVQELNGHTKVCPPQARTAGLRIPGVVGCMGRSRNAQVAGCV